MQIWILAFQGRFSLIWIFGIAEIVWWKIGWKNSPKNRLKKLDKNEETHQNQPSKKSQEFHQNPTTHRDNHPIVDPPNLPSHSQPSKKFQKI
jgi:hypothetical protein